MDHRHHHHHHHHHHDHHHHDEDVFQSMQEARLGLRACNNEESLAVDWIMRRRGERQRNEELVKKERRDKKRKQQFGKTIGGKDVNLR